MVYYNFNIFIPGHLVFKFKLFCLVTLCKFVTLPILLCSLSLIIGFISVVS